MIIHIYYVNESNYTYSIAYSRSGAKCNKFYKAIKAFLKLIFIVFKVILLINLFKKCFELMFLLGNFITVLLIYLLRRAHAFQVMSLENTLF